LVVSPRLAPRLHIPLRPGAGLAALLLLGAPLLGGTASAAYTPQLGDFFDYHFHRHVGNGGGEYEEYADDTISDGHYEVIAVTPSQVTMHTYYRWSYTSNDAPSDRGVEDRQVSFSISTRHFTSPHTDNDELDGFPAANFAVWFWINPDVRLNEQLLVFDNMLTVTSLDATIWIGMSPKHAIKVEGSGVGSRNDNYGQFNFRYTDTYYFDITTGWFIAERYVERDTGTWNGSPASFTWTEDLDFGRASYTPEVNTAALAGFWAGVGLFFAILAAMGWAYRWRTRVVFVSQFDRVRLGRLKSAAHLRPMLPTASDAAGSSASEGPLAVDGVTQFFGHFLEDFARKGEASGDTMAVASAGGRIQGLALYNKEGDVGAIFAQGTGLAEALRKFVRSKDFFTEWRHSVGDSAREWASEMGVRFTSNDAYNLLDTYDVLRLSNFPSSGYDTSLVTRMKPEDLADIAAIAKTVFKVDSKVWLAAQLAGRVIGFGMATAVGRAGRLHTLAVLPEFRTRGIGRELVRARLGTLSALGARYVIAEVARWNIASLELLYAHGFEKVGSLYVETARTAKPARQIVRR
jgi:ribosomal protein S18 acetylase RimI-like enzyme